MDKILTCPVCQFKIQDDWFFCPNCAKELKEKPLEISISKQVFIYLISFFLAPIGLAWSIKYFRSKNNKIRNVGIISVVLTVISVLLMMLSLKGFVDQYTKILNQIM